MTTTEQIKHLRELLANKIREVNRLIDVLDTKVKQVKEDDSKSFQNTLEKLDEI